MAWLGVMITLIVAACLDVAPVTRVVVTGLALIILAGVVALVHVARFGLVAFAVAAVFPGVTITAVVLASIT